MLSAQLIAAAVKYGLIAVIVAGGTWYAVKTVQRAAEADKLEATLKMERNIAASKQAFDVKIDGLRQDVERRFGEVTTQVQTIGAQRRERIIERLPANSRPCLSADVVRLLNGSASGDNGLPAPSGSAHAGAEVISKPAGTGLR